MNNKNLHNKTSVSGADAEFIGYQMTKDGNAIPLYNITVEDHPLRGSTVSENSLRTLNLRIPENPEK